MRNFFALFLLTGALLAGAQAQTGYPSNVTARDYFGMPFNNPIFVSEFPGKDSVYLVANLDGRMTTVFRENNAWETSLFDSVTVLHEMESGLMGFAFHPGYEENGKYFIFYVERPRPGIIHIAERIADSSRLRGSGLEERKILTLPKPYDFHNGGTIAFGNDGYLYTAIGDGGGADDPENRAQDPMTRHGKFLRFDVDGPDDFPDDSTRNYAIPSDNPFVDSSGYLPEIWAIGLRSPWKWSFHPVTGEIWLGDVGQSTREKVNLVPKGSNLGWKTWEGTHCFTRPCSWEGITMPVHDMPQSVSRCVIGGVFYHGNPLSPFHDAYIFGDYINGRLWAMRAPDGVFEEMEQIGHLPGIVAFNVTSRGEILVSTFTPGPGRIFVLESPDFDPVGIRQTGARITQAPPPTRAELIQNRERYLLWNLDGRRIHGMPSGTFLYTDRESPGKPRIMHLD